MKKKPNGNTFSGGKKAAQICGTSYVTVVYGPLYSNVLAFIYVGANFV